MIPVTATMEVLLVEDDPGDVLLTREALDEGGFDVRLTVQPDGTGGLGLLRDRLGSRQPLPDLVLLDLNLPGLHGHEVLHHIRHDAGLRHLPVIVMSTSDSNDDILTAYQAGANSYVTKPVTPDEFHRAVTSLGDYWFTVAKIPGRLP